MARGVHYYPVTTPKAGCSLLLLILAAALATGTVGVYLSGVPAFAALVLIPPWVWAVPGLLLAGLGAWLGRWVGAIVVAVLWIIVLLTVPGEPRSVARGLTALPDADGPVVRVVSLNCAGGNGAAAWEVIPYRPDIVLLQESPPAHVVEMLGRELFGAQAGVIAEIDTSIVARGALDALPLTVDERMVCAHGRLTMESGIATHVLSVRFAPPLVDFSLWRKETWRRHRELWQTRRAEVERVAARIDELPHGRAILVGGDMNAPAGDGALLPLLNRTQDTFRYAGRGWGNTVLNDTPVHRIDQVWASPEWRPLSVTAHRTEHSDHRLVVADLLWEGEGSG